MSIDIADYDKSDYDYIRFWKVRQYENQSERMALSKLLPNAGDALVDLGGGFGRFADLYSCHFSHCLLLDYSQKNLDQAKILAETANISNLETKRGNIYDLPYKDGEFEVALMIRVIHHLYEPQKAINEAARILKPGGTFILEFANKIHFKARVKAWLKGNLRFTKNLESIPIETKATKQSSGILFNYHPKYIQQILKQSGFTIEKKISVSNIRIPILKKIIPLPILLFFESIFQRLSQLSLHSFYLGPSIFLCCKKKL